MSHNFNTRDERARSSEDEDGGFETTVEDIRETTAGGKRCHPLFDKCFGKNEDKKEKWSKYQSLCKTIFGFKCQLRPTVEHHGVRPSFLTTADQISVIGKEARGPLLYKTLLKRNGHRVEETNVIILKLGKLKLRFDEDSTLIVELENVLGKSNYIRLFCEDGSIEGLLKKQTIFIKVLRPDEKNNIKTIIDKLKTTCKIVCRQDAIKDIILPTPARVVIPNEIAVGTLSPLLNFDLAELLEIHESILDELQLLKLQQIQLPFREDNLKLGIRLFLVKFTEKMVKAINNFCLKQNPFKIWKNKVMEHLCAWNMHVDVIASEMIKTNEDASEIACEFSRGIIITNSVAVENAKNCVKKFEGFLRANSNN